MFIKSLKDFFHNPIITVPNLLLSLFMTIISNVLLGNLNINSISSASDLASYTEIPPAVAKFVSSLLLIMLFYFLFTPLIKAATNFMACKVISNNKVSLSEGIKYSPRYYIRLIGIAVFRLLVLIIMLTIFLIACIPVLLSIKSNASIPMSLQLLMLVFAILSILVFIILTPLETIAVHDNIGFVEAISKGIKFGFKNFLWLFGVRFLLAIIILFINRTIPIPAVSTFLYALEDTLLVMYIVNLYDKTNLKEK